MYIEDRKKDMILCPGFNVYPNESGKRCRHSPRCAGSSRGSAARLRAGEVVALFVVKRDPNLTAEVLVEHCRTSLTGYKVPRHIYFRGANCPRPTSERSCVARFEMSCSV